ncbi:alcohol dehydrogenase, zinc-containing, putative [Talaromyces stipitatus ATCC 10500]|uniref:Alcohol dehydrogenase, zinc-containing, putative n=1 Tax=Talaromyces stipitatus (strain ATCC 10500 / CBS 375.48 / QM 6759 / NRRL 1006) TaxID=441959 RepID=B8M5F7_TALSN|nr:alcohol dehydrogenase, zinc-containing, putative [Talaromyces stipitatus ATCC 10500]EED19763.1 alcohol dehydrogenase, zinc-containing, putative [Talaromyces stipitatus ATCC 10500]
MAEFEQWATSQDGIDKLRLIKANLPKPGPNEVLVKIHTVALNYRDVEVTKGEYTHHKQGGDIPSDLVPCSDMCGTIIEVGEGVSTQRTNEQVGLTRGDRVISTFNQAHLTGQVTGKELATGLGLPLPGVLAEYRVFPAYGLVKVPDYLSDEQAALFPIAGLTAWMSLYGLRPVKEWDCVLLQGTGGVSIAGLKIAKASGCKVIITSSDDQKLARAKQIGADYTINYRKTPDWEKEVLKYTSDHGADIILEIGGSKTLRRSFDCIAWGGLIASIGYLSGKQDDQVQDLLNINVLALRKNVTLKGILNGPRDQLEELLAFAEKNKITFVVDKVFEWKDAKEAFKYVDAGSHFGKVIIKVDQTA